MSNISKIKIKNADGTEKEYNVSDDNIGVKIGNLEELTTEDKSNLVNAINEVKQNSDNNSNSSALNVVDKTLEEYLALEEYDPDTYYNVIDDVKDSSVLLNQIGNLNRLQTNDKSNLVNALNESMSIIDGIPVDLTGIYNTQVIGYDEKEKKLVPMINVARTEQIMPTGEIPASWTYNNISQHTVTTSSSSDRIGVTWSDLLVDDEVEYIITSTRPYILSEFTKVLYTGGYSGSATPNSMLDILWLELSKTPDFSQIEAKCTTANLNGDQVMNITHLKGAYYWRFRTAFTVTGAGTKTFYISELILS